MHAVVRFLIDEAKKLHVVPVDDMADFFPNNEFDFDKKFVYSVYWHDPVEDANTGLYDAQVLMLAGKLHDHKPLVQTHPNDVYLRSIHTTDTKEDLERRMLTKRLPIPKVPQDVGPPGDHDEPNASQRKTDKQVCEFARHSVEE
ncbi:hypothetical protein HPB48_025999 [Haemaphysalis longicornis]|uniref:Uncharacterized protein n=1 Tax=Haemaphysalis longicornis TaxID=44386 RepID=A0A9J6HAX0_HAELO|nr:hypothetical protein HPB48_025999 [Haemaphysalis longicornis]